MKQIEIRVFCSNDKKENIQNSLTAFFAEKQLTEKINLKFSLSARTRISIDNTENVDALTFAEKDSITEFFYANLA